MRGLIPSLVLLALVALVAVDCGGAVETETTGTGGASQSGARNARAPAPQPEPTLTPEKSIGSSGASSSSTTSACTTAQAECQPFEPGVHRWGCHTLGTQNELACERADGSAIARCNCAGMFGEPPPDYVPEPGAPPPPAIVWFDLPATDTPFTTEETLSVWRDHCGGPCAPIYVRPPPDRTDAGR